MTASPTTNEPSDFSEQGDAKEATTPDNSISEPQATEAPALEIKRAGYVALIGRPNVGKSTLLNALLGQKISIVTSKPQTTRQRVLGIKQTDDTQLVFVDTPGIHSHYKTALNKSMNKAATSILHDVDMVLWLVDGDHFTHEDEAVLELLKEVKCPVGLAINKVDQIKDKKRLLPVLQARSGQREFAFVIPISARRGQNLEALEQELIKQMPDGGAMFPEDQVTDVSDRFLAAETVREKLVSNLQQEIPYGIAVQIEQFSRDEKDDRLIVHALIWIERASHKSIVIGKNGSQLKSIGRAARLSMCELFGERVHLEMWVKVKPGWQNDERALRSFGLAD